MEVNFSDLSSQITDLVYTYAPKLLGAIVVYIIGNMIIKWMVKRIDKVMEKRETDDSLKPFLRSLFGALLKTLLIISVLGMLGVEMTSFIAILGAAGLAVGLALQGSLANFAAGFLMIIFRPFRVGDFIEGAGVAGVVESIQIFTTTLRTGDNKTIIIPNAKLSGDNIINYSAKETRRVDMTVGVAYDADLSKVKHVLNDIIAKESRIHADPAPQVAVAELADSSVNFVVRVWTNTADYWGVKFDVTETIKNRFDEEGIGIPFPQRDIHIVSGGAVA